MGMRHAAVVAGLAMGLMAGSAMAATMPVTYNVNIDDIVNSATGTITTDGAQGTLSASDILSFSLTLTETFFTTTSTSFSGTTANVSLTAGSPDLTVQGSQLLFSFSGDQDTLSFASGSDALSFYAGKANSPFSPAVTYQFSGSSSSVSQSFNTEEVLGTSGPTISTVPLPAAAPMFGAALLALATVGYGLKRKSEAAAAA